MTEPLAAEQGSDLPMSVTLGPPLPVLYFACEVRGTMMFVARMDTISDVSVLPSDPADRRRVLDLMQAMLTTAQANLDTMKEAVRHG